MLSTMAPKKAHQNPEMKKPGTKDEASCNMKALMTIRNIPKVIKYIQNQREHHRRKTFQEEYLEFLRENNVEYDERYIWG